MLKASEGPDNLRILLPMISGTHELEEALHRSTLRLGRGARRGRGYRHAPIGMMVEIPAAVYQTRELARQVDFRSVRNDLTLVPAGGGRPQNPRVADLYDYPHPAAPGMC